MFPYKDIRIPMSEATRALFSKGVGAATAAIQRALNGAAQHGQQAGPQAEKTASTTSAASDFVSNLLSQLGVASPLGGTPAKYSPQFQAEAAAVEDRGRFLTKSFANHAGSRSYKLYIPSSYDGQAMPLMVMLHGCTQNPDDFAAGTQMNTVAEEKQCFVVYPAQTQSANSSKCWNWFKAVDQQREQGEPSIIAGITREVIRDYGLDAGKVYIAGLSAGGAMAIIMGTTYPDLYAAVGVHSGLPYASAHDLPSALSAMKGAMPGSRPPNGSPAEVRLRSIPIIVFHGDHDTTVNARNGDRLIDEVVSNFVDERDDRQQHMKTDVIVEDGKVPNGHRFTRTSHHVEGGHAIAEHWVIHGAGHAWAGGHQGGSYTDGRGPDASQEMLRFFYTQPGPLAPT